MPDLNSLPPSSASPSRSPSRTSPQRRLSNMETPSRSPSVSLAAAATLNQALRRTPSASSASSRSDAFFDSGRAVASPSGGPTPNSTYVVPGSGYTSTSPQLARESRRERRRSSVMASISLNNPGVPGPGELQSPAGGIAGGLRTSSPHSQGSPGTGAPLRDPFHQRQPSLGEIHQEIEMEGEAHVVRQLSV
jgi:hypothetical protein